MNINGCKLFEESGGLCEREREKKILIHKIC